MQWSKVHALYTASILGCFLSQGNMGKRSGKCYAKLWETNLFSWVWGSFFLLVLRLFSKFRQICSKFPLRSFHFFFRTWISGNKLEDHFLPTDGGFLKPLSCKNLCKECWCFSKSFGTSGSLVPEQPKFSSLGLSAPESPVSRLKSAFLLQSSSLLKLPYCTNFCTEWWCFSKVSFGTSAGCAF